MPYVICGEIFTLISLVLGVAEYAVEVALTAKGSGYAAIEAVMLEPVYFKIFHNIYLLILFYNGMLVKG